MGCGASTAAPPSVDKDARSARWKQSSAERPSHATGPHGERISYTFTKDGNAQWQHDDGSRRGKPALIGAQHSFVGSRRNIVWKQVKAKKARKREAIPAEDLDSSQSMAQRRNQRRRSVDAMGHYELILAATRDNPLFEGMPGDKMRVLVREMEDTETSVGQQVITQGEAGSHFYVVASGEYHASKVVKTACPEAAAATRRSACYFKYRRRCPVAGRARGRQAAAAGQLRGGRQLRRAGAHVRLQARGDGHVRRGGQAVGDRPPDVHRRADAAQAGGDGHAFLMWGMASS